MGNSMMILSAILVPIFFGLGILIKPEFKNRNTLLTVSGAEIGRAHV